MKYLKTYDKVFESVSKIEEVADTLTTEVFDEFNIRFVDYENYDIFKIGEFWGFTKNNRILIGNLDSELYTNVINEIITIKPIIFGRTGVEIDIEYTRQPIFGFIIIKIIN